LLAAVGFGFVVLVAWALQQVFSGRGAMLHTGALMVTWMTGNVFLVSIPNRKKVIADLLAGREPDPALGKMGKTRRRPVMPRRPAGWNRSSADGSADPGNRADQRAGSGGRGGATPSGRPTRAVFSVIETAT
jgi:hypothetical protein